MRKSAPIRLTVLPPDTDAAKEALAKAIAQVHADAVMREILALSCPTEQKLALLDAVMDAASFAGIDSK